MDAVIAGLVLSLFAGLSTAVGALIIFFIKDFKQCYLGVCLAFSTGVMLTVSFVELLPAGMEGSGKVFALFAFFVGAVFAFLIDYLIPHRYIMEKASQHDFDPKLFRVGLFVALGLAIHNFPEGFAVFMANQLSLQFGLVMAVAIAMHNIPEGISVAVPVYYATKKKRNAFFISFLSGLAEPVGAVIAALFLLPFLTPKLIGASLAFVAGVMVYICVDELLPTAYSCAVGKSHMMTFSFLLGSLMMGLTIVLLP